MRHSIAALLALAGAIHTVPAMADWEYTKWGMTPEQVASASKGTVKIIPQDQRKRIEEVKMENAAEGILTDGDLRMQVAFSFDTNGSGLVAVGYAVMDETQNNLLMDWLTRRYGPPQHKEGIPSIGLTTWDWDKPDEIEMNISKGTAAVVFQSKRK